MGVVSFFWEKWAANLVAEFLLLAGNINYEYNLIVVLITCILLAEKEIFLAQQPILAMHVVKYLVLTI